MDQSERNGDGYRADRQQACGLSQNLKILLFAGAAEAAKSRHLDVAISLPTTIAEIALRLEEICPALRPYLSSSRFAVDQQFVESTKLVTDARAEIALIPQSAVVSRD